MSTASGTNNIHGTAYVHRGTNWLNADPFFYNADPNIPDERKESRSAPIHAQGERSACRSRRTSSSFTAATNTLVLRTKRLEFPEHSCHRDLTNDRSVPGLAAAAATDTTFATPQHVVRPADD